MHHKTLMILALIMCRCPVGVSQGAAVGSESAALGGICVVLQNPWSAAGNPAGLAGFGHLSLNTSLQQNYLMPEIGNYAFAVTAPVRKGTLGGIFRHYGFSSYLSETIGLAWGVDLGETFCAGTALYYFFHRAGKEFQATHLVSYSLGLGVRVNDRLRFGFAGFNPFNTYFKSEPQGELPAIFMLGAVYAPSPSFQVMAEVRKDMDYPVEFILGGELRAKEKISLRGGMSLFPASFSAGAGLRLKKMTVEIAAFYHQYLGFTPSSSLQYIIK
jgi:hypothetical protein